jgi:Domain of unknown function (DUF5666)
VLAALALAGGQVQAQTPPGHRGHHGHRFFGRQLFGTVASVSPGSLVLTTWTGDTVTLQTTPTTRTLSRQRGNLSDLAPGDFARVVATKTPNGVLTARSIGDVAASLAAPPAPAPAGGAPSKPGPRAGWNRMAGAVAAGRDGTVMISGRIIAVSNGRISIANPIGNPFAVAVPSGIRISRLVSPPLASLAAGTHVIVRAGRPRGQQPQGTPAGAAQSPLTAFMVMVVPTGTR